MARSHCAQQVEAPARAPAPLHRSQQPCASLKACQPCNRIGNLQGRPPTWSLMLCDACQSRGVVDCLGWGQLCGSTLSLFQGDCAGSPKWTDKQATHVDLMPP